MNVAPPDAILLIGLGFGVGACGTLVGAGGGFILVPVLLFLYPEERPAGITSISLAVVFFNALSGSIAYARDRRIDYRSGLMFAAATVPGTIFGALFVGSLPREQFNLLFGIVLVGLSLLVIFRPAPKAIPPPAAKPGMIMRSIVDVRGHRYDYHFHPWRGIALSVGVGFVSSLLGIGGGIIHVPGLVLLLDFPVHIATATSHFILAIMALMGTSVHVAAHDFSDASEAWRALWLAAGVIPGAQIGARLSRRVRSDWIVRALGTALLLVGTRLLLLR